MVAGEPGWCARVLAHLRKHGREKVPRRKIDWCPVCDRECEYRLIANYGAGKIVWKAWACQECDVVRQEAGG